VVRTNLESCGRLPLFFVLAFAITWSVWISATTYTHGRRRSLADEANLYHLMSLVRGELDPRLAAVLLLALFSCGPGLAGLLITELFHDGAGLTDLERPAGGVPWWTGGCRRCHTVGGCASGRKSQL
jgi:hypothetical protein